MSKIKKATNREPVMVAGVISSLMNSVMALSTAFGWMSFNEAQVVAVNGVIASLTLTFNFFARNKVTPT